MTVSVTAFFKKSGDQVAEYEVSIDGGASQSTGPGAEGRSKALARLAYLSEIAANKEKYRQLLEDLEKRSEVDGTFDAAEDVDKEMYMTIIADGEIVYEGYDVDEAFAMLARNPMPSKGHRGPGI